MISKPDPNTLLTTKGAKSLYDTLNDKITQTANTLQSNIDDANESIGSTTDNLSTNHNHDSRYYTKTYVDSTVVPQITVKANAAETNAKSWAGAADSVMKNDIEEDYITKMQNLNPFYFTPTMRANPEPIALRNTGDIIPCGKCHIRKADLSADALAEFAGGRYIYKDYALLSVYRNAAFRNNTSGYDFTDFGSWFGSALVSNKKIVTSEYINTNIQYPYAKMIIYRNERDHKPLDTPYDMTTNLELFAFEAADPFLYKVFNDEREPTSTSSIRHFKLQEVLEYLGFTIAEGRGTSSSDTYTQFCIISTNDGTKPSDYFLLYERFKPEYTKRFIRSSLIDFDKEYAWHGVGV